MSPMTLPSASLTDATSFAATDIADRFLHLCAGIEDEPDVVGLVHVRLDTQEPAVQRIRLSQVLHGIDDCSHTHT
jgi:hypothetical protein